VPPPRLANRLDCAPARPNRSGPPSPVRSLSTPPFNTAAAFSARSAIDVERGPLMPSPAHGYPAHGHPVHGHLEHGHEDGASLLTGSGATVLPPQACAGRSAWHRGSASCVACCDGAGARAWRAPWSPLPARRDLAGATRVKLSGIVARILGAGNWGVRLWPRPSLRMSMCASGNVLANSIRPAGGPSPGAQRLLATWGAPEGCSRALPRPVATIDQGRSARRRRQTVLFAKRCAMTGLEICQRVDQPVAAKASLLNP
jgi:hypothetical protein